jgi:hypothetical protein
MAMTVPIAHGILPERVQRSRRFVDEGAKDWASGSVLD